MKTNLDMFKTNEESEKLGVWFKVSDEVQFLVKRFGGANEPKIKSALAKYFKPYAYQIQQDTLDSEKQHEIFVKVFVDSCLEDWKGVEIDGKEAEFSKDLAIQIFVDNKVLFNAIKDYASDFKTYRDDLGNS